MTDELEKQNYLNELELIPDYLKLQYILKCVEEKIFKLIDLPEKYKTQEICEEICLINYFDNSYSVPTHINLLNENFKERYKKKYGTYPISTFWFNEDPRLALPIVSVVFL
jgi:hypothetical protein